MERVSYNPNTKQDHLFVDAVSIIDSLSVEQLQDPMLYIRQNGRLMAFCSHHIRREEIRCILGAHLMRHHHLLPQSGPDDRGCSPYQCIALDMMGRFHGRGSDRRNENFDIEFGQALKELAESGCFCA